MHDNDSKYTSGVVKDWLKQKTIQTLLFIGFKSHRELERRVKKHQPKNPQELGLQLTQEWNNNELLVLEKLVDSVASRLYECVKMKGYPSKY